MSVLFTNRRTRDSHKTNLNAERGEAECNIDNFEFIVWPLIVSICKQNTN